MSNQPFYSVISTT